MKRLPKVLINLIAVVVALVACFSFTACGEDIKNVKLTLQVYDYENEEYFDAEDVSLSVNLYAHLAPKTVAKMGEYVKEGYYNNAIVYRMADYNQVMFGDLVLGSYDADNNFVPADMIEVFNDGESVNIVQNAIKPQIQGEFTSGGTVGSNLLNTRGNVGLWRTWYEGGTKYVSSSGMNTGRATWYMPNESLSAQNGYFCVFGVVDLADTATNAGFTALEGIYSTSSNNYDKYVIYFTGEYDESKADDNHGLEFHCCTKEYFDDLTDDEKEEMGIFEAENDQFACYNAYTIYVANNAEGKCGALIKTASITE